MPPPERGDPSIPKIAKHPPGPGRRLALLGLLLALAGCDARRTDAGAPLLVLAASDLQVALPEIAERYRAGTGQPVELVFGSTGNLTAQIEQGAPADLFFAANERFLDRLIEGGHVEAGTRAVYGVGRIVVVWPDGARAVTSLEALRDPAYGTVSIANPEHAPYGTAAREALVAAGLWDELRPRLVYGENVVQADQFVRTGNADAGIVALALVLGAEPRAHLPIDEALHAPLRQAAGVVRRSSRPETARAFLDHVMAPAGQETLRRYGFGPPGGP
jgi:molybdate transport system substrate-binding protein